MPLKTPIFSALLFFLLSGGHAFALELEVFPKQIEFKADAAPATLELRVFDAGKPMKWNSNRLKGPSSKINLTDSEGKSLGFDSESGMRFIPMGTTADGLTYKLMGVVDRSVKENSKFQVRIKITNEPELVNTITATVSELSDNSHLTKQTQVNELRQLSKEIAEVKSGNDMILLIISAVVLGLFWLFFSIQSQVKSLTKSDVVTENQGNLIKQNQEKESSSIKEQQKESHHALFQQGMNILNSTHNVHDRTHELIRVTEKIDLGIRDIARNPEQSSKQVVKDFTKLKELLVNLSHNSKTSSEDLSHWISKIEEDRESLIEIVEEISDSVNVFSQRSESFLARLDQYDKVIDRLYNFCQSLVRTNEEAEESRLRKVMNQTIERRFKELGLESNH